MADKSSIEWTEASWNCVRGCSLVSAGCANCYAMRQAHRFSGEGMPYEGLTRITSNGPVWTGEVRLAEETLDLPLRWKRPRRIFVNSMSDLFHQQLTDEQIDRVFAVMALCPQHTFQVLTKRAERACPYLTPTGTGGPYDDVINRVADRAGTIPPAVLRRFWPLRNVWIGVSVEDQKTADERIPWLLKTPAAVRWVSYEPAIGPIDFEHTGPLFEKLNRLKPHEEAVDHGIYERRPGLEWIVVGGESGPGARPFDVQWARDTIAQCKAAGVPVFVKQVGAKPVGFDPEHEWFESATKQFHTGGRTYLKLKDKKGGDIEEWPADIRVREFPEGR